MNRPMIRTIVLIAAAVALAGCAGDARRFYKEGATQADYDRDAYACERDTLSVATPYTFGRGFVAAENAKGFAVRCMISKGWEFR